MSKKRIFSFSELKNKVLLAMLFVALIPLFAYYLYINIKLEIAEKTTNKNEYQNIINNYRINNFINRINLKLKSVEDRVHIIRTSSEYIFQNTSFLPLPSYNLKKIKDTAYVASNRGSTIIINRLVKLNPSLLKEISLTNYLDSLFKETYESLKKIDSVYLTTKELYTRLYPWNNFKFIPNIPAFENIKFKQTELWTDILQVGTDKWLISCFGPVYLSGGVLKGIVGIDFINTDFSDMLFEEISSPAFILNTYGQIIMSTKMLKTIIDSNDITKSSNKDIQKIAVKMLTGESGTEQITASDNKEYIISYAPLNVNKWSLGVLEYKTGEPLKKRSFFNVLFNTYEKWFALALILIFITIIASFVSEKLTRSLRVLIKGAEALKEGNFNFRIPIISKDEIGDMANAFNQMASAIQIRDNTLEQKVQERTFELATLNDISNLISQTLDLNEILSKALFKILDTLQIKGGCIHIPKDNIFKIYVYHGLSESAFNKINNKTLNQLVIGNISAKGQIELNNDFDDLEDDKKQFLVNEGYLYYISIPLLSKEKTLGIITLFDRKNVFKSEETELVSAIGKQLGVAIENIQLYKDLKLNLNELKNTQAQLVQAAKLASIGTLAAGVAHELNQPLTVIRGYSQLLLKDIKNESSVVSGLKKIEEQTTRMKEVINHLKDFFRQSKLSFEPINIKEVIDNVLLMFQQQLKIHNIEIIKEIEYGLKPVYGNKNHLEQVLINLLTNAKDAILSVYKEGKIKISACNKNETFVLITVQDTGTGILPEYMDKIFDPFFTTKEVGAGTGLGLSISYGLIKDMGGFIEVESKPAQGSIFKVILPVC